MLDIRQQIDGTNTCHIALQLSNSRRVTFVKLLITHLEQRNINDVLVLFGIQTSPFQLDLAFSIFSGRLLHF